MLTDCYKVIDEGFVSLSGRSVGADGVSKEIIASLSGGDALVEFKNTDSFAKNLVYERLNREYLENDEGFIIVVDEEVTVYADNGRARLYAACAIEDMYDGKLQRGVWWSYPLCAHRSLRIFLPPKTEIAYFHTLIDQMVHLGYNSLLLEICGAMEFKTHPEINRAWVDYCASVHEYPGKYNLLSRAYYRTKNSVHTCNAGGAVYSQDEMRALLEYCRERFIEVIPEVPSLSHSEYILVAHPELRERPEDMHADTYCPSNPDTYKIVFDIFDEVIEVFEPKNINIGHDEL